jgi:hypothetical protein
METAVICDVPTVAGKANPRTGSSDTLTPLKPEREGVISPTAYLKALDWMTAMQMGEVLK